MKYLFSFIAFIFITDLSSQIPDENLDFLFPGDSIPTNTFMLDEVQVFQPLKFNNDEEIKRYLPFITKHIEIINPKILVLLGSTAMNALIGNEVVISKMRGKWIEKKFGSCKTSVIITFHPAFLMRQPAQKKMAWIDLKMIRDKKI